MKKFRFYAALPFVYTAFRLLNLAAIILGESYPGRVGIFYDKPTSDQRDEEGKT